MESKTILTGMISRWWSEWCIKEDEPAKSKFQKSPTLSMIEAETLAPEPDKLKKLWQKI